MGYGELPRAADAPPRSSLPLPAPLVGALVVAAIVVGSLVIVALW